MLLKKLRKSSLRSILQPSLAWKITLWYIGLLLLTVFMLSALIYWGNRQALLKEKLILLNDTVAQALAVVSANNGGLGNTIQELNSLGDNIPRGVTLQISSTSGGVLWRSGHNALPYAENVTPEIRVFEDEDIYYAARPIQTKGITLGYLQAAVDLREVEVAQRILLSQLIWIGVSAVLLAAIGGLFLARQVLYPVEALNKEISQLTARDLHRRLPLRGNGDELDRLGQSFNKMLGRLERSFEQQKQFVADASHELRTPLMVIRGHADILQRWGADDPAVTRESAKSVSDEVATMSKLVDNLLILAREDFNLTLDRLNLSELIIDGTAGLPYLQEFNLEYDIPSDVSIVGDAIYLKQVLRIILENASKYVPSGGTIKITLSEQAQLVQLSIADNGPGIPEAELEHIFDRFYRIDKARSRTVPGHGLGLSIAKRIVEQHGGRIWAENIDPHGAHFIIDLPKIAQPS